MDLILMTLCKLLVLSLIITINRGFLSKFKSLSFDFQFFVKLLLGKRVSYIFINFIYSK